VAIGNPSAGGLAGDPCDIRSSYRLGANAAKVAALCVAQGVPNSIIGNFTDTINSPSISGGGNPNLKQETANSYTIGGVWRSRLANPLLSNISVSIDYYNIAVTNAISTITFTQSLLNCFNASGANPTYSNTNQYCQYIQRNPSTGLISTNSQQPLFNIGEYATDGIDFELDYGFKVADLGGWDKDLGDFTFNAVATRLLDFTSQATPTSPVLQYGGTIGQPLTNPYSTTYPGWKGVLNITYALGRADAGVQLRYISSMKDSSTVLNPASTTAGVPAYTYVDLSAGYRVTDRVSIRGGVTNLFNKEPPIVGGVPGFTDQSAYDIVGRAFYIAARAKF
jgi:outer membrane receptor protein involved in Fe transport